MTTWQPSERPPIPPLPVPSFAIAEYRIFARGTEVIRALSFGADVAPVSSQLGTFTKPGATSWYRFASDFVGAPLTVRCARIYGRARDFDDRDLSAARYCGTDSAFGESPWHEQRSSPAWLLTPVRLRRHGTTTTAPLRGVLAVSLADLDVTPCSTRWFRAPRSHALTPFSDEQGPFVPSVDDEVEFDVFDSRAIDCWEERAVTLWSGESRGEIPGC